MSDWRQVSDLARNQPQNPINFALQPSSEQVVEQLLQFGEGSSRIDLPTDSFWRDRFPFLIPSLRRSRPTAAKFGKAKRALRLWRARDCFRARHRCLP